MATFIHNEPVINLFLGIIFVTEPLKINFKVYTLYYERTDLWQEMFVPHTGIKFGLQHFMKLSDSQSIRHEINAAFFNGVFVLLLR